MKRIKVILTVLSMFFISHSVMAQNPPTIGEIPDDTIIVTSGSNYLIIPQMGDGDGTNQVVSFEVISSEITLLEIDSVVYRDNENMAVIFMKEKGLEGDLTLTITASDSDGSSSQDVNINIGLYDKGGLHFEIHDAVFWQEVSPVNTSPVFDTIIHNSNAPYNELNWDNVPITVNGDCTSDICTGHDFFTAMLRGYIIPSTDGDYTFYLHCVADGGFWISDDENINNAQAIAVSSDSHGDAGTIVDGMIKSEPVSLEAGKRYAIYAINWVVHSTITDIYWEGPGITKSIIEKENLMYEYDPVWPLAPENIQVSLKAVNGLKISWDKASDDVKLIGYNIYVDGVKVNNIPIKEIEYSIENLLAATNYTIAVASVDRMGNESFLSDFLSAETYPEDSQNPTPPTNIILDENSGLAAQLSWSGAEDAETEVIAYNIYLDGELYNNDDLVFESTIVLKVLSPETSYNIEIEAIDAGYNISAKSEIFNFSTLAFDAYGPKLGVKRGVLSIEMDNISWTEGIGINPNWMEGVSIKDPDQIALLEDFQPGSMRWGGIGANSNSHSFVNHIGTGKTLTYGSWIDFANGLGSYSAISIAVENGSDFIDDINTFEHLIEYINGPETTTYGAIRESEGYGPLLENSKGLVIEFGNEVWGGASHMSEIGEDYEKYALWCRDAARIIKASPYYDPDKIHLAISGRNIFWDPLNRATVAGDTGEVDWLAPSGYFHTDLKYNPDIDPWKSELNYYKDANLMKKTQLGFMVQANREIIAATGEAKQLYFYESNMSESTYNGRLGQAITLIDYHLASMKLGSAIPSLFNLSHGQWKITQPTDNYSKLPHFHAAEMVNRFCKGSVLKTKFESIDTLMSSTGYPIIFNSVGGYAFTNEENFSIVLMSRDFEDDYYVQINLPDDMIIQNNAKKYVISGTDFSTIVTTIDSSDISLTDGDLVKVPKYSMVLINWQSESQNFEELPVGFYTYQRPESISIVPDEGDFTLTENRESKYFLVKVEPTNTFYPAVKWEILQNDIGATINPLSDKIRIKANGTCEGNGSIIVRATAVNNPLVFEEATILISNQGTDCNTSIEDYEQGFSLYPNPAKNTISVHLESGNSGLIKVYNSMGSIQLVKQMELGKALINLENINAGVYFMTIEAGGATLRRVFVKE